MTTWELSTACGESQKLLSIPPAMPAHRHTGFAAR